MGLVERAAEDGPVNPPAPDPNPADRRLRVGLLLGSARPPRWQATMVRELADAGFIDLRVCVADSRAEIAEGGGGRPGIARRLFRLYERVDRALFGSANDALAESELGAELRPRHPAA